MKKTFVFTAVMFAVGIALTIVGAIFAGVVPTMTEPDAFDLAPLARTLTILGIVTTALCGVVLVAIGVAKAVKGDEK